MSKPVWPYRRDRDAWLRLSLGPSRWDSGLVGVRDFFAKQAVDGTLEVGSNSVREPSFRNGNLSLTSPV